MIPQVVHQVWLGGGPLPPILGAFVDGVRWRTWEALWRYRLWSESDLCRKFGDRWFVLDGRCCHLSQRSNVARYLILEAYGGLYLDTDVELFALPEGLAGAWIAGTSSRPGCYGVNPCVLAACPGHAYVERMLMGIERGEVDLGQHMSAGPTLAADKIGPDVNVWPADVWHGRRGQSDALGHHYGWGPKLKSFLRCHGMPPTGDACDAK